MSSYIQGQQRPVGSTQQPERQLLSLKTGQVIHGKVISSLGNQQMEVILGGRILTAVVSGAISEGEARWFQVESNGNPPVLKPVKTDSTGKPDIQQILQSAGLGGNKEIRELVSSMIRQQIPVSADKLTAAANLLSGTADKTEGLSVIKWMFSKDIPLKEALFQPILTANKGVTKPLSGLFNQLKNQLSPANLSSVSQVLQQVEEPYLKVTQDYAVQRLFEKMMTGSSIERNQSLEALKEVQILPKNATLSNWTISLHTESMGKGIENLIKALGTLPQSQGREQQVQLQQALKAYQQTGAVQQLAEAVVQGQGVLLRAKPPSQLHSLQVLQLPTANTAAQPQGFSQALNEVQQMIGPQNSAASIQVMLKEIIHRMGQDYEARMMNAGSPAHTLKAQLVNLLETPGMNPQTRDTAEQMLNRLNGMQLLSADNGPQQQLIMQFPLQLGTNQTDVMMKMNGRKKNDGSLDLAHVRVLFYITLAELNESIIDMNVQNRVVSLDIYNENKGLDQLAKPLIPTLEAALEQAGYIFSGVKFHSTGELDPPIMNPAEDALSSTYHKVDIKI
ncbi:hypothetical protein [Jeotgalibacillus haloalkalitolerans]|uniref:Flagellar hook-length control protein-like C-terminal domain-containing protein n=1 Tax=Jeotgalibacillus haloalkalitolerans TaxID=3104292 RepID=A0ABU5KKU5_9BACL|nr:hypothetical protein [Jeotgalibacillus sp. HH7-29]MDZ5711703.1 hypothetical protein [Jeotgalibacillus sp. HH7-29]